jgi:hypothetical protein
MEAQDPMRGNSSGRRTVCNNGSKVLKMSNKDRRLKKIEAHGL